MKKTIIALTGLLFTTLTQASTLSTFNGKYKVDECSFSLALERAYVSSKADGSVKIQLYGQEAVLVEMAASTYTGHNPSFELGNAVKDIAHDFKLGDDELTTTETYIYASGEKILGLTEVLKKTNEGLLYTSYDSKNQVIDSCKLLVK